MDPLQKLFGQKDPPEDTLVTQLTEGEYVIPRNVVEFLGGGDHRKGIELLDNYMQQIKQRMGDPQSDR